MNPYNISFLIALMQGLYGELYKFLLILLLL
jgi:hypothetical protein